MAAPGMTTTVPLPFIPSVLAWNEQSRYLVAAGTQVPFHFGTDGLAVIDAFTGDVKWHQDDVSCMDAVVAGSLIVVSLGQLSSDPGGGLQGSLEAHDLISGTRIWQRTDIVPANWSSLAADRAGRLLAVSSGGCRLLEAATGEDHALIPLTPAFGVQPAFAPSGTRLALAYTGQAGEMGVAVCDTSHGTVRHQTATQSAPLAAGFDEAGRTVTVVEAGWFVTVVDAVSGTLVSRTALEGPHAMPVIGGLAFGGLPAALSPDRRIVLVAERAGYSLYAAATGARLGTVPSFLTVATRIAFSPTARAAVVTEAIPNRAVPNNAVALSAPRPQVLWQQNLPRAPAAAFSLGGRLAVAQQVTPPPVPLHGAVLIGVVEEPCLLSVTAAQGPGGMVLGVGVMSQGTSLVACICADRAVRLFTVQDGRLSFAHRHPGPVNDLVLLPNGLGLATACSDGQLRLLDASSDEPRWSQRFAGPVNALGRPASGAFVCGAGSDKTVRCLDAATGAQRWQATLPAGITRMVVSPDGAFVVTAGSDRTVRLLRAADGTQAWQVQHDSRVRDLAVSADGRLVATAAQDGTVRVLAGDSGAIRRQVSHSQGATSVAFSADGHDVISGSLDCTVLVGAVADPGAPPAELLRASAPIAKIEAGPGRSVAVITGDRLIRLVDLDLRCDLARIYASAAVGDIDADGGLIASGASDGTIRVDTWGN